MSPADADTLIRTIVARALEEDLGEAGDVTSEAIFDPGATAEAVIRSKEAGVVAGTYLLAPIFSSLDSSICVEVLVEDGDRLEAGGEICRIRGSIRSILAGERTALNFLQRLSGIATRTARCVALLNGTRARLLDTRKTTPSLRILEKRAVVAGGGYNHRFGLFDMMLIKDTHVKAAGSVTHAVRTAREHRGTSADPKIEVEVRSEAEFREALGLGPDRIMFDNMSCPQITKCLGLLRDSGLAIETEASGNISEENIAGVARTGVDFISCGSLTHSVQSLDIHLVIL